MKPSELREQVDLEYESIQLTLDELASLKKDIRGRQPTVREMAAAGLFLANYYNGIENILKRICRYHEVTIPSGGDWHVELAKAFCQPPQEQLPALLDQQLAEEMAPYRQFRHVVHHGYGFRLRWNDMLPGIERAADIFSAFWKMVEAHLRQIESEAGNRR